MVGGTPRRFSRRTPLWRQHSGPGTQHKSVRRSRANVRDVFKRCLEHCRVPEFNPFSAGPSLHPPGERCTARGAFQLVKCRIQAHELVVTDAGDAEVLPTRSLCCNESATVRRQYQQHRHCRHGLTRVVETRKMAGEVLRRRVGSAASFRKASRRGAVASFSPGGVGPSGLGYTALDPRSRPRPDRRVVSTEWDAIQRRKVQEIVKRTGSTNPPPSSPPEHPGSTFWVRLATRRA